MKRNLVNYQIEKIDALPTKQKFYDSIDSKLKLVRRKEYYYHYPYKWTLASKILKGSVGRLFPSVYVKIAPLVKDCYYNWFASNVEPTY